MDYKLPLTTCATCAGCGIGNLTQLPACTSLVVRMSFSGISGDVELALVVQANNECLLLVSGILTGLLRVSRIPFNIPNYCLPD